MSRVMRLLLSPDEPDASRKRWAIELQAWAARSSQLSPPTDGSLALLSDSMTGHGPLAPGLDNVVTPKVAR